MWVYHPLNTSEYLMTKSASTNEVTNALRFFVSLMISFDVDDQGYIIKKTTGERLKYGPSDTVPKEMVLYQENLPRADLYIINPFSEGLGENSPPTLFFYKFLRISMIARVRMIMLAAVKLALESKNAVAGSADLGIPDNIPQTGVMLNLVSGSIGKKSLIDEIDAKMLSEIDTWAGTKSVVDTMIDPIYDRSIPGTRVQVSAISKETFLTSTPGMRKNTAKVIRQLLMNILQVREPADLVGLTRKRTEGAPVRLSSWLETLYAIYERINQALVDVYPEYSIDMGDFRTKLDELPEYSMNAKFMIIANSNAPTTTTAATVAQTAVPALTGSAQQPVPSTRPQTPSAVVPSTTGRPVEVATAPQMPAYGAVQAPVSGVPSLAGGVVGAAYPPQQQMMGGFPQYPQPQQQMMMPGYGQPMMPQQPMMPGYQYGVQQQPYMQQSPYMQPAPTAPVAQPTMTTIFNPVTGQNQQVVMPSFTGGGAPGMPYGIR